MINKKIGKCVILTIVASIIVAGTFIVSGNKKENKVLLINSNVVSEQSNVDSEYKADTISVMGFSELDYMKAMSFILTKGNESSYSIDAIDFNGLTIEEHLANLNAAASCENIDPVVMLCQQILETSIFMYKYKTSDSDGNMYDKVSVVKASDFNFAGLGATDGDGRENVNIFLSNAEGQLAQAQHLKAYASTEDVSIIMVDYRFNYVQNRGDADTISGLSARWASNESYGNHIARLYNEYLNHKTNVELVKEYYGNKF